MILVPRSVRVYFATQPTNLRMSFEGLSNAVREVLRQDPLAGHIFVFLNRRKNMVKLLVYTRGGYTIVHKRLEAGTFTFPAGVVEGVASVAIGRVLHHLDSLVSDGSGPCCHFLADRSLIPAAAAAVSCFFPSMSFCLSNRPARR